MEDIDRSGKWRKLPRVGGWRTYTGKKKRMDETY
jgi:hypothetical protein